MVYVGEIVNTHGIKGELRIVSDFKYKEKVFINGNKLYLGKRKQKVIIDSYRKHKNYDMVKFDGINDINDAIIFKGDEVYIKREDLDIELRWSDTQMVQNVLGIENTQIFFQQTKVALGFYPSALVFRQSPK